MKQVGLALLQYSQDYDESLPIQVNDLQRCFDDPATYEACKTNTMRNGSTFSPNWAPNWISGIKPYTKSSGLYQCPSAVEYEGTFNRHPYGASTNSYMANSVVIGRSVAVIPNPSEIIWAQEQEMVTNTAWIRPRRAAASTTSPSGFLHTEWLRNDTPVYSLLHFDGGNFLFCDGHVKFRKRSGVAAREYGIDHPLVGYRVGISNSATGYISLF